ncbi:hypothetical protein QBC42DRAFT_300979 [Cladorrhinum samala]|uniref:Zonadhesin n=1 Tax=Cladorrhinum samala TaxID=585594 RepID=A0AAV9HDV7_9PEZI|nr:hypothetical protein QBC42DRAFT_300979 [Cladorrhinum samala]
MSHEIHQQWLEGGSGSASNEPSSYTRTPPGNMAPRRRASVRRIAPPDYKPMPLRWPFLVSMIVVMMTFIAVLESACRLLPPEEDRDVIPGAGAPLTSGSADSTTSIPQLKPRLMHRDRILYARNGSLFVDTDSAPAATSSSDPSGQPPSPTSDQSDQPSVDPTQRAQVGIQTSFRTTNIPAISIVTTDQPTSPTETPTGEVGSTPTGTPTGDFTDYAQPTSHHADLDPATLTNPKGPVETPLSSVRVHVNFDPVKATTVTSGVPASISNDATGGQVIVTTPTSVAGETKNQAGAGSVAIAQPTPTTVDVVTTVTQTTTISGAVSEYTSTATVRGILVGGDPSYEPVKVVTVTDSNGTPTVTITSTPPLILKATTVVVTENGTSVRTVATSVVVPARTTTLSDSQGVATATVIEYPTSPSNTVPQPQEVAEVYYISNGQYFVGAFLPTLLAVALTIPVRMIDMAAKQFQPWHALTHRQGASAKDSLCLRSGGWHGIVSSVDALVRGQVLMFLTSLLTLCSIFVVPLSSEAVALKLHGSCSRTTFNGCAMTLGVFLIPARATMALLALMIVVMILLLLTLHNWRTGVAVNPWTIAGVASLATNPELRGVLSSLPAGQVRKITQKNLLAAFEDKKFRLGHYFNQYGNPDYGVMVLGHGNRSDPIGWKADAGSTTSADPARETEVQEAGQHVEHHLPFLMLSYTGRIAFLLPLTGVMIVILYWNNTGGDTPFNNFMKTQGFGVRGLFTLIGVGITFFWSSFFTSLAILSPYLLLSQSPRAAQDSIILSPPMNAFSGIWGAIKRRHFFLIVVASIAILTEFMPVLLSNVPFRVTQTWLTSRVCNWLAVGILCVMWLAVVGSFFVSWPHMPVDPSTIGGAMYYVCDSWMLWSLEGFSMLNREGRDRKVAQLGFKVHFGNIAGLDGRRRVGVDRVDEYI